MNVVLLYASLAGEPASGGTRIGIVGMLVVFAGLALLTLLLPLLRRALERRPRQDAAAAGQQTPPGEEEITAAVCAIHAHLLSLEHLEDLRLTLGLYDKPYRPWRLAGRAEALAGRQSIGHRPRNRS